MKSFSDYLTETMTQMSAFWLPRSNMPQISDYDRFTTYLASKGIDVRHVELDADSVRPTQSDFDQSKVDSMVDSARENGPVLDPIIVAKMDDGQRFVLDGHHRLIAAQIMGVTVPTIEVDITVNDLLRVMYAFDHQQKTDSVDSDVAV